MRLVQLIMPPEDVDGTKDDVFPNAEERKMLRYYHYIKHGIDTAHVAPLASKVLKKFAPTFPNITHFHSHPCKMEFNAIHKISRIMNRIPLKLRKHLDIVASNVSEVRGDYIFASKKSVVNFVLGQSLEKIYNISTNSTSERIELREIGKRFSYKYLLSYFLFNLSLFQSPPSGRRC